LGKVKSTARLILKKLGYNSEKQRIVKQNSKSKPEKIKCKLQKKLVAITSFSIIFSIQNKLIIKSGIAIKYQT